MHATPTGQALPLLTLAIISSRLSVRPSSIGSPTWSPPSAGIVGKYPAPCGFSVARATKASGVVVGEEGVSWGRLGCAVVGRTFSGSLYLPVEASNNSTGCVSLVEGVGELLASRLKLLPQSERVQHAGILCARKALVNYAALSPSIVQCSPIRPEGASEWLGC